MCTDGTEALGTVRTQLPPLFPGPQRSLHVTRSRGAAGHAHKCVPRRCRACTRTHAAGTHARTPSTPPPAPAPTLRQPHRRPPRTPTCGHGQRPALRRAAAPSRAGQRRGGRAGCAGGRRRRRHSGSCSPRAGGGGRAAAAALGLRRLPRGPGWPRPRRGLRLSRAAPETGRETRGNRASRARLSGCLAWSSHALSPPEP